MGDVFLAGVRPDSPSRSDTFLLLRVVARLRSGGRVRSYVVRQAWSPTIRPCCLGSSSRAACTIGMLVRKDRRYHEPDYGAV